MSILFVVLIIIFVLGACFTVYLQIQSELERERVKLANVIHVLEMNSHELYSLKSHLDTNQTSGGSNATSYISAVNPVTSAPDASDNSAIDAVNLTAVNNENLIVVSDNEDDDEDDEDGDEEDEDEDDEDEDEGEEGEEEMMGLHLIDDSNENGMCLEEITTGSFIKSGEGFEHPKIFIASFEEMQYSDEDMRLMQNASSPDFENRFEELPNEDEDDALELKREEAYESSRENYFEEIKDSDKCSELNDIDETIKENVTEEQEPITIEELDTHEDYKKMSLNKLRNIALSKNLIIESSKYKKNELIELLTKRA